MSFIYTPLGTQLRSKFIKLIGPSLHFTHRYPITRGLSHSVSHKHIILNITKENLGSHHILATQLNLSFNKSSPSQEKAHPRCERKSEEQPWFLFALPVQCIKTAIPPSSYLLSLHLLPLPGKWTEPSNSPPCSLIPSKPFSTWVLDQRAIMMTKFWSTLSTMAVT